MLLPQFVQNVPEIDGENPLMEKRRASPLDGFYGRLDVR